MMSTSDRFVMPGDIVLRPNEAGASLRIGIGLSLEADHSVIAVKAGFLRKQKKPEKMWVDNYQKRYFPVLHDPVIGVVTNRKLDEYVVDIGAFAPASLSWYAFEGATKRNHPNLSIGDVVFGRISVCNRDFPPELVCFNASGRSSGFGPLEGGHLIDVSLPLSISMRKPRVLVTELLGKSIPFEMTAGVNGKIWINASNSRCMVLIANAIEMSERLDEEKLKVLCAEIGRRAKGG